MVRHDSPGVDPAVITLDSFMIIKIVFTKVSADEVKMEVWM